MSDRSLLTRSQLLRNEVDECCTPQDESCTKEKCRLQSAVRTIKDRASPAISSHASRAHVSNVIRGEVHALYFFRQILSKMKNNIHVIIASQSLELVAYRPNTISWSRASRLEGEERRYACVVGFSPGRSRSV